MSGQQAESLGDVVGMIQKQASGNRDEAEAHSTPNSGLFVAPGVRFSNRLWAKLGGKAHASDRQTRRERISESTALPAPRFDIEFRRDSIWKQRECRIRQAYVQHLENLTLQKDDEKEALQKKVMQKVTGVYKQAEEEAIKRLHHNTSSLQAKTLRQTAATSVCEGESQASLECYKANPQNPLACWDMVAAFESCARLNLAKNSPGP